MLQALFFSDEETGACIDDVMSIFFAINLVCLSCIKRAAKMGFCPTFAAHLSCF